MMVIVREPLYFVAYAEQGDKLEIVEKLVSAAAEFPDQTAWLETAKSNVKKLFYFDYKQVNKKFSFS